MRNGQVADGRRIEMGMGMGMRGARGPAHVQQGRAGQGMADRQGYLQDRIGHALL
jgi:hypothetical protein